MDGIFLFFFIVYEYCFNQHLHVSGFFHKWLKEQISIVVLTYLVKKNYDQIPRDAINIEGWKYLKYQCTRFYLLLRKNLSFQCIGCDLHFFVLNKNEITMGLIRFKQTNVLNPLFDMNKCSFALKQKKRNDHSFNPNYDIERVIVWKNY